MGPILISTVNCGLGSAGKLAAILPLLPSELNVVAYGSELGESLWWNARQPVLERVPSGASLAEVVERFDVATALVVLDTDVAIELTELGVRVVYVDSIPYLWNRGDRVPSEVAVYLAQQPLVLPELCWPVLRSIPSLRWIGAIVPTGPDVHVRARRRGGVVVNLGGLGSSARPADRAPYPAVVLPPVLRALESVGHPVTVTCSQAGVASVRAVVDSASGQVPVRVVALDHNVFLETMNEARLLLTSPGLTTILEAGVAEVPTVLLPPQNLSQFVNVGVLEATTGADALEWPVETLRRPLVEQCRARGAAEVVAHIDKQIAAAVGDQSIAEGLTLDAIDAIHDVGSQCVGARVLDVVGRDGAAAVASCLVAILDSG